jgi:FKBP-type peptidyl-prolyl cis-trans isomerase FklB
MKKVVVSAVFLIVAVISVAQKTAKKEAPLMKNLLDSFSYAAGYNVASNMLQQNIDKMNIAVFKKAMEDVFAKKQSLLTQEQVSMSLQAQLMAFKKEKLQKNKVAGAAYMAKNKSKKGVTTLPNGLQYEVLTSGTAGAVQPTITDTVVVHYIGTFIDGKEFDNSYTKGNPATFSVNGVVIGWTTLLQSMKVGDKWRVTIPSDWAYGDEGRGSIPGGATLCFDMHLLEVKPSAKK